MRRSPERTAWIVLFASLFTCCALAVGIPAAALTFYNTATTEATINVRLQAGQMSVWRPNQTDRDPPSVVSLDGYDIGEGSRVALGADSTGLLTLLDHSAPSPRPFLTLQLYPNTRLLIERARLPRFGGSALSSEFAMRLGGGRIQVTAPAMGRKFNLRIWSDHGSTQISMPGLYVIEHLQDGLRLSVVEGQATAMTPSNDMSLNLLSGQRTTVTGSAIAGILPAPRNLIRNGQFTEGIAPDWQVETLAAQPDAPLGTVSIIEDGSSRALLLERMGERLGWGRTGVMQTVNAAVGDSRDLRLVLDFAILYQELPVCASVGSECPLFVSIVWRDSKGGAREWIQGFYAVGTPQMQSGTLILPDAILTNPQRKHIKMPLDQRVHWESENLIPYLPEVQTIEAVKVYAEGHAVRTRINGVALLVMN